LLSLHRYARPSARHDSSPVDQAHTPAVRVVHYSVYDDHTGLSGQQQDQYSSSFEQPHATGAATSSLPRDQGMMAPMSTGELHESAVPHPEHSYRAAVYSDNAPARDLNGISAGARTVPLQPHHAPSSLAGGLAARVFSTATHLHPPVWSCFPGPLTEGGYFTQPSVHINRVTSLCWSPPTPCHRGIEAFLRSCGSHNQRYSAFLNSLVPPIRHAVACSCRRRDWALR